MALKRGASSSEAMDAVQTTIAGLLHGRTGWNPVEGPGMSDDMMATIRRTLGHKHKSARHRYEAPSYTVEDAPDPHGDPSSTQEATAASSPSCVQ